MKTNFDNIRRQLIGKTNGVMEKMWMLRAAFDKAMADRYATDVWSEVAAELDDLERRLDGMRNPVVAIGCLESDGGPDDMFKALDFDLHSAKREEEDGDDEDQ